MKTVNVLSGKEFPQGFINLKGYEAPKVRDEKYCFGLLPPKAIYEFTLNSRFPLTLKFIDGFYYRPNKHFFTDQGSVPRLVQFFVPKDRFLLSFIMHDSAYKDGGLWKCKEYDGEYKFYKMTRSESDYFLQQMILLEPTPGGLPSALTVWIGVRLGGAFSYHSKPDR